MRKMTIAQAHKLAKYIRKVRALNEIIDMDNEYSIQAIRPNAYAQDKSVLGYELKSGDKRILLAPEQAVEVEFLDYHAEIRSLELKIESYLGLQAQLDKAVAEFEAMAERIEAALKETE